MNNPDILSFLDTLDLYIRIWLPSPLFGVLLLTLAAILALAVHDLVIRILRRLIGLRFPFVLTLLSRIRPITRLALIVFLLGAVLPGAGFGGEATTRIAQLLLVAFILLFGWASVTACQIGSEFYLRRYRMDVEDNLLARKHVTQTRILKRALQTLIVIVTVATALMTFDTVRQYGVSLFASAGAAGLIVGLAARPLLSNLIAGVQIAITQPIRVDDAVIVAGEWGWIEEITSTYVVIKIWDLRRLIVPLSFFLENSFQNWTRQSATLIGSVYLYVDYTVPVDRVREKLTELAKASSLWDGDVASLQVTDAKEHTVELRAIVSARNSGNAWDLRCEIREKLIAFLKAEYPSALPVQRVMLEPQSAGTVPDMGRR